MRVEGDVVVVAHFRLDGDWELSRTDKEPSRFARGAIEFTDGSRVSLVDPRALATLTVHRAAESYLPALGPDPTGPDLDVSAVCAALARRSIPIKQALLDQKVLAGVGNIYAAEALWLAKIDPRVSAKSLGRVRCQRLLEALRAVLSTGDRTSARYRTAGNSRIRMYGNEGKPCPECGTAIRRITQGTRSTWFCPACQPRR
jgi:formamidopyrimidine-DNA glycosylase